jgi:nucleotide-binding universal stress UspA family protein
VGEFLAATTHEEEKMYTRMLIPLDSSKTAENVLPYGRILARTFQIPVELMEVLDIAASHVAAEKARHPDTVVTEGERSSEQYLKKIASSFSDVNVKCTVERGRPEDVIIEKAAVDKTTLIAMATHGRSGMSRWLLGSIAEKVLRATTNPLLLVRANEEAPTEGEAVLRSIIVPLDGSELAESVLPTAVKFARFFNVGMVLFRAYELPASAYYGKENYLPNYEELKNRVKEQAQDYLDKRIEAIKAEGVQTASSVLIEGSGPNEIIDYARKSPNALITMCTHGRSGMKRWVLGSVTEKVVRHSGDPVLVMRGGAPASIRVQPALSVGNRQ